MSSGEQVEAEQAITDALFVLKCIEYNDEHLSDVGRAIDFYEVGNFKSAAILATAFVRGRSAKRLNGQVVTTARARDELERIFRTSHKRTCIELDRGNALSKDY